MLNKTVDYLLTRKGQIVTMHTIRDMKVRKGEQPIQKESTFQCRIGVNYDNIAVVQDKRDNGELPEKNAGLPWGHWVEFPYVIEHKDEYYIRCTTLNNNYQGHVRYLREGVEITRAEAEKACLAAEFPKSTKESDVFNIKVGSILDVK